ncbi:hypothetical protein GmRootV59_51380 [Variovorax sp. V59]
MSKPTASSAPHSHMPREREGFFCASAPADRRVLLPEEEEDFFLARPSRGREGSRSEDPGAMMTVLSSFGRLALAEEAAEAA